MFDAYDFVDSNKFAGKIILTSFPGLNDEGKFDNNILASQLELFSKTNVVQLLLLLKIKNLTKLCDKKLFVEKIYRQHLKWYHLPIQDLGAPNQDFKFKWETTKVLLKNELIEGSNVVFHCRGGKGRAGTIAAILLVDFGYEKKDAIELVRERRKGAIETKAQEDFITAYRAVN